MITHQHHITTSNRTRAQDWERIFGTAVLPVLDPRPRFVTNEDGHLSLIYDLALSRISQTQQERFAASISRRTCRPYGDVLREVKSRVAYPIKAHECKLVSHDESETAKRPSRFMFNVFRALPAV